MVRLSYQNIANSYYEVKQAACGRQACSVMIMVAYEVDAMSSCKMLTQLLRSDNIAYTIRPVLNFDEVVHNFQSFLTEDIKSIFMVNCGALYNIPKIFDLEQGGDFRVFILDNHRPLHLANIYSKHSVVVFDDTFDPTGEYDVDSLPSEGSDLSGGLSSSESEHSSEDEEEDEEMFDEELQEDDIDAAFGEDGEEEDAELDDDDNNNDNQDGDDGDGGEEGDVEDNPDEAAEDDDDQSKHSQHSEGSKGESLHSETRSVESGDASDSDIDATEEGSSPLKRKLPKTKSSSSIKGKKVRSIVDSEGEEEQEEEEDEEREDLDEEQEPEQEEEEEEEEEVRIRGGRKRRSKEAEEAYRLKERRRALQSYYTKNATYTAPTALMLIELLSTQLGSRQMPTDVVWQAVLGVTYQYNAGHLPEGLYRDYVHFLKSQFGDALRTGSEKNVFSVRANDDSTPTALDAPVTTDDDLMMVPGSENGYVEEASEYRFFLYRHWSLYDAMFHSPYVAAKLNVWNQQGTAKLQELLAKMGVPLQQCRQSYQYMTPALRSHFATQMNDESVLQLYNLVNPGVTFKSFYRYNSFKNPVAASDIVHAATALTELYGISSIATSMTSSVMTGDAEAADPASATAVVSNSTNSNKVTSIDAFYDAYYCLGMRSDPLMQKGIQAALDLQRTIVKKASAMLDGHSTIHRSHRLYYAYLSKTSSSWGPGTSAGSVNANSGAHASGNNPSNGNNNSNGNNANNGTAVEIEHSFGRPMVLAKLGQYIMDIKRNTPKKLDGWNGSALLPFVLLSEKSDGTFLVVGISPFSSVCGGEALTEEQERKLLPLTNFRQFFKLAGQLLGAPVKNISFDANVVEVRKEDVQEFLGALDDSLRKATPKHNSAN